MSESESVSASNMELIREFEQTIAGMEWEEVVSILEETVVALMGDAATPPNPSSSPPPLPLFHPAEPYFSPLPQTEGVHTEVCTHLETAPDNPSAGPSSLPQTHLYNPAGVHGQGWDEWNSTPVVFVPLHPVGLLNGDMHEVLPAAAPLHTCSSEEKQKEDHYVKKPLNTFMLFLKEQRPLMAAERQKKHGMIPTKIAGQKWNALSPEEKAKYYLQFEEERRIHKQRHPNWSASDNYGKKRPKTRKRRNDPPIH